jgi:hypothetical protein
VLTNTPLSVNRINKLRKSKNCLSFSGEEFLFLPDAVVITAFTSLLLSIITKGLLASLLVFIIIIMTGDLN